ncbi:MAG: molybdopterin-dependent oxidoreductase [Armatimonadota bacterium]|nr:molybdopterin-dependent oxidoreductase [Armatimonadota bacterium]
MPKSVPKEDRWVATTCGLCYSVCAIKAHVVDGVVVKIEGNPDSGTNRGRICARGQSGIMQLYDPARVNVPLKRTNPRKGIGVDPGWVEISWDEALDLVAERLRRLRADDPRKMILTGTVTAQDELTLGRIFTAAFGTPNSWNAGAGNHCGNAEHLLGAVMHAAWAKQPDPNYCTYLLNFGCAAGFGSYYAVPAMAQRIAEARARGMRHVCIDPFLSPAAEKADEWIPIRPGTDGALAMAMLNLLLNEYGLYDREHLAWRTNAPYLVGPDGRFIRDPRSRKPLVLDEADGEARPFDAPEVRAPALEGSFEVLGARARPALELLRDQVRPWSPERAEQLTTVPAATIRRLAREFGEAARIGSTIQLEGKTLPYRPVAVMYFKGAQGHRAALPSSLAIELLAEVVGASNVPGGVLSMNARSLGSPETGLPAWTPATDEDGMLLAGAWANPFPPYPPREVRVGETADLRSLFPTCPGSSGLVTYALRHPQQFGVPYRVEVNLHLGANFVMTAVDPNAVVEAFKDMFQVSFSLFLDESTELADVVLPVASYLERLGSTDWLASNTPVDEWSYHLRQPVVPPAGQRRLATEVLLELVERLDMREEFYAVFNAVWQLGEPYPLDPSRAYTWEEIMDRVYRNRFGARYGLDWFREHGVLKWPKKVEEVYWLPFNKARVPIYQEWLLRVGEQVKQALRELQLEADTSGFTALPNWAPCRAHLDGHDGHDLLAIYYKVPLQTFSGTYDNPWLAELSEINPFVYRAALNAETARRKGIADGDWIRITSATTGQSVRLRAAVTQGIHPEVVAIAGAGGHWSKRLPIAAQPEKGALFEWLMPASLDNVDLPTLTQDQCVRVRVEREGGPQ